MHKRPAGFSGWSPLLVAVNGFAPPGASSAGALSPPVYDSSQSCKYQWLIAACWLTYPSLHSGLC